MNVASQEKLMEIPHVKENRSRQIIEYRKTKKITSMDELAYVIGLSRNEINEIRKYVIFDSKPQKDEQSLNHLLNEIKNERIELEKEKQELNKEIDDKFNIVQDEKIEINDNNPATSININTATVDQLKTLPR